MKPVVIHFKRRENGKGFDADLREGPSAPYEATTSVRRRTLALDPTKRPYSLLGQPAAGIVRRCGEHLTRRIETVSDIQRVLEVISHSQVADEFPIFLQLADPQLESLPWEAIWREPLKFLSLHPVSPVARIPPYVNHGISNDRAIEPKLRILAVLSASGVSAEGEWNALYEGIRHAGNKVHLKVIIADTRLRDRIVAEGDPRVSIDWLADTPQSLLNSIKVFQPNLLHFFCHGASEVPKLELVTSRGAPVGFSSGDLLTLASLPSLWVLTLNCCKAAQSSARFYSMARALMESGVGAVIAMKERIDWLDANMFTTAFYGSIVPELIPLLPEAGGQNQASVAFPEAVVLRAMRLGRRALHEHDKGTRLTARVPDDSAEWTLPVLYLRRPFVTLKPRAETPIAVDDLGGKLVGLRTVLALLQSRADTPPGAIAWTEREISAVEEQLGGQGGE